MNVSSSLQQAGRVALAGLLLSGAAMVAAPAVQAADAESTYQIETNDYFDSSRYRIKGYDDYDYCLNDRAIVRALGSYGFEDVEFVKEVGQWKVIFLAVFDDYYYVGGVDRCTGYVDYVTKFYAWEDYQVYEEEESYDEPRRKSSDSY